MFDERIVTSNDAFFVRYHLADIPLKLVPDAFRVTIRGEVGTPLSLSVAELKSGFKPLESPATSQCAGDRRGFFEPRVTGRQLGNGGSATRDEEATP